MKKSLFTLTSLVLIAFTSCTKEAVDTTALQTQSNSLNQSVAEIATPTFSVVHNADGTFTATLRPDATNGQDVSVNKRDDIDVEHSNFNNVAELGMTTWTIDGYPDYLRAYLKFVDLAKIPTTAKVVSATLYLYGLNSGTSTFMPQGNSVYPGSPYNFYGSNSCIIEQVLGPWDETTLTWSTQPKVNSNLQVAIPQSTSQWNNNVALTDVKTMVSRAVKYPNKNFGVRIKLNTEQLYRSLEFATSEATDAAKRPKLVVVYK